MTRDDIMAAVSRGWVHPPNANKVFDADLAVAIVDEISTLLGIQATPVQVTETGQCVSCGRSFDAQMLMDGKCMPCRRREAGVKT